MTISVRVSCNGNYKCPVSYKQGDRAESFTLSGRGKAGPDVRDIPFYHGADAMTLSVGPEEQDNGEDECETQAVVPRNQANYWSRHYVRDGSPTGRDRETGLGSRRPDRRRRGRPRTIRMTTTINPKGLQGLVERLRNLCGPLSPNENVPIAQAADTLESLAAERDALQQALAETHNERADLLAENERLREALEPFARMAVADDRIAGLDPEQMRQSVAIARKALSGGSEG
jgi:hypothetical protein